MKKITYLLFIILSLASCATSKRIEKSPKPEEGFDAELIGYTYPYPVSYYAFESQGQKLKMAYMDIKPEGNAKKTIVLLHGKNFSGFYFEPIIKELVAHGFRVIAPDQIGFGKSTKPQAFQYSFHTMAKFTADLLTQAGVKDFILTGHSMGGILSTRMALMYPERVKKLILVNPIGLEDYKTLVPFKTIDEQYEIELKNNETKIRDYQKAAYYDGNWKPEYEPMIVPAVGWTKGPDHALIAKNSVLINEIMYTQPVYYEFKNLKMPVTMINGQRDKTAPGKALASPENQKIMGNYPKLGQDVIKMIPHGKLIPMKGLGHVPFVEDFQGFMKLYMAEL
jgi:pimeloyl-ACP methyl ester carboxylesterase